LGISKSSVDRHKKALERRNRHPESWFWETEEGQKWLHLLVVAVLYEFAVGEGVGAGKLSRFFKRIRLEKHFGASPTALLTQLRRMEDLIADYQQFHEEQQRQAGTRRDVVAGGDETFFKGLMMLVLMDLPSGYLLMEEVAEERSYETWNERAQKRLDQLGCRVIHFVSDRAKALIKLALEGFGCRAGADLFHGEYEISKWLGLAFHRQLGSIIKKLGKVENKLSALRQNDAKPEEIQAQIREFEQHKTAMQTIHSGKEEYHNALQEISRSVHPFTIEDNSQQTSEQVEQALSNQALKLQEIAEKHTIADTQGSLDKFRRQIKDLASIVAVWWVWATESLATFELEPGLRDWLLFDLLPVIYWHKQVEKTQNNNLKRSYKNALERALTAWQANPFTQNMPSDEIERWRAWAEWMTDKFQRTSSAVEGRNGWLSQMYHNGRGLAVQRLTALTVMHNFDLRRDDGTTAAERLFGTQFPDLFEWVVGRMGELPLARRARERVVSNPLIPRIVPA